MPCRNPACRCCVPEPCDGRRLTVRVTPDRAGAPPIVRSWHEPGTFHHALGRAREILRDGFWFNETDTKVVVVGPGRVLDVTLGA